MENVALLRKRLRDPALVAISRDLPHGRAGAAVVVYLAGRAHSELIQQAGAWLDSRAGEEALRRGLAAGSPSRFGLLPDLMSTQWPDKAGALLDAGHVLILVDRMPQAYGIPVTAPALLYSPGDDNLRRPIAGLVGVWRVFLAGLVVLASAAVVALQNYHPEMVPTPFLLALASLRENAPWPIFLEVLFLEFIQELIREAGFRLPISMPPAHLLIMGKLTILTLVVSGLVGPLPALVSIVAGLATTALPSYELVYMSRVWRLWMILAAGVFGLYGMAIVLGLLLTYLTQARSFGVPFIGETGVHFTAPGGIASQPQGGSFPVRKGRVR